MITFYSENQQLRDARTELYGGELVAPFERPGRALCILEQVRVSGLGEVRAPGAFILDTVFNVHDRGYVEFLRTAWDLWEANGYKGEAIACNWPVRRMGLRVPSDIDGLLGYYSLAAETSITPGTWKAALASKDTAQAGADLLNQGATRAFSLCRPPGHHAAIDMYGGYCFLNNAAIAAQHLLDQGADRIAILDVDYHHGNGTQDIFYTRDDVLFVSLHADPAQEFPHFLGYADETGSGRGEGFNVNYPMPRGTTTARWFGILDNALGDIRTFSPDALVVSLGVDTYRGDPISTFQLETCDFNHYGRMLAGLGLPTLFVMEGGYDIAEIGLNTVSVLNGFEDAA